MLYIYVTVYLICNSTRPPFMICLISYLTHAWTLFLCINLPLSDAIQRKLQHTINRLEKWTLKNGFTISKNKTVAMHFCPDKKYMDPFLKLDNDPIPFVKEAKFPGLIWDTKLTFEPHIKYLKAKWQNPWTSWKSSPVQNGVQIELHYWNYIAPWLDQN